MRNVFCRHAVCRHWLVGMAFVLIGSFVLVGCDFWGAAGLPFWWPTQQGASDDGGTDPAGQGNGNSGGTNSGGINSIQPAGEALPEFGVPVTVVIVSRSANDATVLVRYFVNDVEVHRSELLVQAGQTMTAIGPDLTTRILVTGQDAGGDPLPQADWLAGQDFNAGDVKQYIIVDPDACPADPAKTQPGICGCGVPDIDTDGDGTMDCNDACPNDPNKIAPGVCGCGVLDIDTDGDGTMDCKDACPNNPNKIAPGVCGCLVADVDANVNGIIDCLELPPNPDADGDGVPDANDNCPALINPGQEDCDQDGKGDACTIADCLPGNPSCQDCNGNGIPDGCDISAGTSLDLNRNGIPDECQPPLPTRRYVNLLVVGGDGLTWATAYANPRQALDEAAANPGTVTEIWVAAGTYTPDLGSGDRLASFRLVDGVKLLGGFVGNEDAVSFDLNSRDFVANPTVLSGDIGSLGDGSDNSHHVIWADSNLVSETLLDGFAVTSGNADGQLSPHDRGAGMYADGANVRIQNCAFVNNQASSAAGGLYAYQSTVKLNGCVFVRNLTTSATIGASGASAIFFDNTLVGSMAERCFFGGNFAGSDGGAVQCSTCSVTFINCSFVGNVAVRSGGAMLNWDGADTQVVNCTFAYNYAGVSGGAVETSMSPWPSNANFSNCILWDNTAPSGTQASFIGNTFSYSIVQGGGFSGSGMLTSDPRFVGIPNPGSDTKWGTPDDYYGDLSLRYDSPAIDAGDNYALWPTVTIDLPGLPRFVDYPTAPDTGQGAPPIVDMGAYEFSPS